MGTLLSIINGLKNSIKNTIKASQIAQDPSMLIKIAYESIKSFITGFLKVFASYAIIIVILLAIVVGGVTTMFDTIKESLGGLFGNNYKYEMATWAENLTDEEIKELEEQNFPLSPKKLPKFVEIENESYPKTQQLEMKIKTDTEDNYNDNISRGTRTHYMPYEISLKETAYPYRLWWQMGVGLDIIATTGAEEWTEDNIVEKAKEDIKPIFEWGYDQYSKDITEMEQKHYYFYVDGTLVTKEINQKDITEYQPLPFLKKAKTMFHEYDFVYEEDVETLDTGWGEPLDYYEHTWEECTGYDEEGNCTGTITYTEIRYRLERTRIVEDLFQERIETVQTEEFYNFLYDNDISGTDMEFTYEILKEIPHSEDFLEKFAMAIDDYEFSSIERLGYLEHIEVEPSDFVYGIPSFYQTDSRWKDLKYGKTGSIGASGCGVTALSMVVTGMGAYESKYDKNSDSVLDPYEVALFSMDRGHYVEGVGTAWALFKDFGEKTDLKVTQIGKSDYEKMLEHLKAGNPVIASVSKGHFTGGGHFIVLVGIDSNGKLIIQDPNYVASADYYLRRWKERGIRSGLDVATDIVNKRCTPTIVLTEAKQYWVFEK